MIFPLDSNISTQAEQIQGITDLEKIFAPEKLRCMSFDWIASKKKGKSGSGGGEWVPQFDWYWQPAPNTQPSVKEIWREHAHGIGGRLSLRELRAHWGTRWRRGKNLNALKVEGTRRGKVIKLVERLMEAHRWSEEEALKYITAQYPIPSQDHPFLTSMRRFQDYLGKKGSEGRSDVGIEEIVAASLKQDS